MTGFALKLLLAHILGDFVLQPDRWIQNKRQRKHRSISLYLHLGIHALALLLLLQFDLTYWAGMMVILLTHFIIDLSKLNLENRINNNLLFFIDQAAHGLVLVGVVFFYHPFGINTAILYSPASLLLLLSFFSVTSVSAIIMRLLMNRWQLPEDNEEDSLPKAGKYIGMLERLLVFSFIVLQQWAAIGWLIAAKSILRFSDLSRAKDRKLTEYVLIGTLLSFGLAIAAGLFYLYAIDKF